MKTNTKFEAFVTFDGNTSEYTVVVLTEDSEEVLQTTEFKEVQRLFHVLDQMYNNG